MTKAKLKDATKDLLKDAETVMESVARVRKGADELVQTLRKFETQYTREEEQRRAEEKQAEQQRLVQQHTKAYTMPDTEEEIEAAKPTHQAEAAKTAKTTDALTHKEPAKASQEIAQSDKPVHTASVVKAAGEASAKPVPTEAPA